jgi:hypothetical protein
MALASSGIFFTLGLTKEWLGKGRDIGSRASGWLPPRTERLHHHETLTLDPVLPDDPGPEPRVPEEAENLPFPGEFRDDEEEPTLRLEDPGKIGEEPPDNLPAGLSSVEGPLEPVVQPFPG